jgi:hypothetical protein
MPAGGINILGGLPSAGKSRMLAWWAHAWLTGGQIFDVQVPKFDLCIISTDRSWSSTGQWFGLYEIAEQVVFYSLQDDDAFSWKQLQRREERPKVFETAMNKVLADLEKRRQNVPRELRRPILLYCDTIATFIPNTGDYNDTFVSISALRKFARDRGITILGTMHAGKQRGGAKERYARYIDRIAGSVAITGTADTVCYITVPEETEDLQRILEWQPHHAPRRQFLLNVQTDGRFVWNGQELGVEHSQKEQSNLLLGVFTDEEETLRLGEIMQKASEELHMPASEKTYRRWIKELLDDGRILRVSRGYYKKAKVN